MRHFSQVRIKQFGGKRVIERRVAEGCPGVLRGYGIKRHLHHDAYSMFARAFLKYGAVKI